MGFLFAPKITSFSGRRLTLFEDLDRGPDIALLIREAVDEELIAAHWMDVLRLMTSVRTGAGAIVLRNTTYLKAAMRHLERQGRPVSADMLAHLSPLGWQHINLSGDYLWTEIAIKPGHLRPLRPVLSPPICRAAYRMPVPVLF